MTLPVVVALRDKRQELIQRLKANSLERKALLSAIASLDVTVRTFDPSAQPNDKPPPAFKGAELRQMLLSILKNAPEPISARMATVAVLTARGLPADDKTLFDRARKRVEDVLYRMRGRRMVDTAMRDDGFVGWRSNN